MAERIEGLIAPVFTPMNDDQSICPGIISEYFDYLAGNEVRAIFLNGSTGEAPLMSMAERMKMLEVWQEFLSSKMPINFRTIVNVSHSSIEDAKAMAKHAEVMGVAAISAMAPSLPFFKPLAIEDLVLFMRRVSDQAPSLPFYYYHFPAITKIRFDFRELLVALKEGIPNMAGLKFSDGNIEDLRIALSVCRGSLDVFIGHDGLLGYGMSQGAVGMITTGLNLAPELYQEILEPTSNLEDSRAEEAQEKIDRMNQCLRHWHYISAAKLAMKSVGLDLGPARCPLPNYTHDVLRLIERKLKGLGVIQGSSLHVV